jgi:hypothetical protein
MVVFSRFYLLEVAAGWCVYRARQVEIDRANRHLRRVAKFEAHEAAPAQCDALKNSFQAWNMTYVR